MPSLSLPWVIGPIPIVITVWAAYECGVAVAKQRATSGEAFVAALMLPIGLIAIVCQLFLSDRNLNIMLITCQFIASFCFFIVMHASGWRRIFVRSESESNVIMKYFVIGVCAYVLFNVFILVFHGADRCTVGKCFILEWGLGRIDHIFVRLYLGGAFGALMLIGILPVLFEGFLKVIRNRFRIK
ncbi:hypothetical protein ACC713_06525 [Rhizobium johnstonii]|uniref:Transmembrane protein n=2 Tax=Rhizobium TaxID=379 RepID=A0A8G2J4H9_RHILV|nr:hypothetical protein [Rhizobium leguminosarum]MBY5318805.1 hypothetical protein [Rhizobium leguminosarum]MBY5383314.1 hypothetical protein [Rhizobium leguminosarum]MBY5386329.1 hypothetical protein [Rhizobium leguminosarum]MBY5422625.1 hypothetical protein [Rhizobium leguminosarum]MBY5430069.1 hypothetical protein [Rhizobium leguminosarum]